MILVDTSVWIDHLRKGNERLCNLLEGGEVLCHPFVIGELACGNLRQRSLVLDLLSALPRAKTASHREVMTLVESKRLFGTGLGWIDAHLLASVLLEGCRLWSLDKALASAAGRLGVSL
ncbi:MAG: type II toxin-antitoxin system VapC family toxin [Deltaproteobacteria bacterium]|nr:MAG: type II toxin-antitoxin system VapC family toxin [Deltaproteobacteria bacterium]